MLLYSDLGFRKIHSFMLLGGFLASNSLHDLGVIIMQDICNKFIEVNFCVGYMFSRPNCL